jgi:hypothetical protein
MLLTMQLNFYYLVFIILAWNLVFEMTAIYHLSMGFYYFLSLSALTFAGPNALYCDIFFHSQIFSPNLGFFI